MDSQEKKRHERIAEQAALRYGISMKLGTNTCRSDGDAADQTARFRSAVERQER